MKFPVSFKPLVLAAALAVSGAASAITTSPLLNVGDTMSFEGVIGGNNDLYSFTLPGLSSLEGWGLSFKIPTKTTPYTSYAFSVAIDGGTPTSYGPGFAGFTLTLGSSVQGPSVHTIEFSGTAGTRYMGELTNVAAVPEPESYAMFLAGLGIMGAVVRRRSSNKA